MADRARCLLILLFSHLIGALVAGLVTLAFVQVVMRYVFSASLLWVEEVSVMGLIWMAWIGVVLLWLTRSHVAVDLVAGALSAAGRKHLAQGFDILAIVAGTALVLVSLGTLEIYSGMQLGSLEIDATFKYYPVTLGGAGLALAGCLNLATGAAGKPPR